MQLVLDGLLVGVYKQDILKRPDGARNAFVRLVFNGTVHTGQFTPTTIMPVTQFTLLEFAAIDEFDELFNIWQENYGLRMNVLFELSWYKPKEGYYKYQERILNWRVVAPILQ